MRCVLSWVLGLVLVAGSSAIGESPSPAACKEGEPCLQVGSFNIELLGKKRRDYKGQKRPKRSKAEVRHLAKLVADDLDLEVVVFQEINTGSKRWKWLRKELSDRGYDFFEGTTSGRQQYLVLAWDEDEVTETQAARELDMPEDFEKPDQALCAYEGARVPSAVGLKAGEFDFWLVGVHLKSRTKVNGLETCDAWIRETQATLLVDEIEELRKSNGEADVLIVGDFNHEADHSSLEPFRKAGFTGQMGYLMPAAGSFSYLKGSDLIDDVAIDYGETRELVAKSGYIYKPSSVTTFIRRYSDHVPILASFGTSEDKD